MSTIQRNQHYVWQHYLRAWTVKNKVWCVRAPETTAFLANPSKIASEAFFYRFHELDHLDLQFLEGVVSQATRPALQDVNRRWIKFFQYSFRIRRKIADRGIGTPERAKLDVLLNQVEKSIGETYMAAVENRAQPILKALRARDIGIIADSTTFMAFAEFISHQYWRTAKLRNAMLALQHMTPHNVERTWPIERFIYATNMTSSMIGNRNQYQLCYLDNHSPTPFIAGDQPVINLYQRPEAVTRQAIPKSAIF